MIIIKEPLRVLWEKLILFLINPFLAFLYSLQDIKTRSSYIVFFLFSVLFGWMFMAEFEAEDSYRYKLRFLYYSILPSEKFFSEVNDFINGADSVKDLYVYFLFWISSLIGGSNYHYFFMIGAVVFAFFMLKSLWYVTNNKLYPENLYGIILLCILLMYNNIYNINGIRFWTAAWMGVYFMFKMVVDKKPIYLLFMLALPLVHLSMSLLIPLFIICWLLRKHIKFVLPILFFSFFVSVVMSTLISNVDALVPYLPQNLQITVWGYMQSDNAMEKMAGDPAIPLYAKLLGLLPTILILLMTLALIKERKHFPPEKLPVLGFYLAYYSISNILNAIPSAGRFFHLAIPFLIYVWVDNYDIMKKYNRYYWTVPISYAYSLLYFYRRLNEAIDSVFFFAPLPYQIYYNL